VRGRAAALLLLAGTSPALAHSPIMGIGGVAGGILHAVLIPEHGLALVALGLVLGQQEPSPRRTGVAIFTVALACGLVAVAFAVGEALAADVLLTATGILGLLVVTLWAPTMLGWILAAIAGLMLGLDSRPEVASGSETVQMLAGTAIGAIAVLVLVSEVSFYFKGSAQRIVARVIGSWITAIAILVCRCGS
jgi:HupE / UreJ protein